MHQRAARHGTKQDGKEGGRFHQTVAGHQLMLGEAFRQAAVFDRAEQRGLHAQAEQHRQQARDAFCDEGYGGGQHQRHLQQLVDPYQCGLAVMVCDLPCGSGCQQIGQDEQCSGQSRQSGPAAAQSEQGQHQHGILDQVVVQRATALCQQKRP